MRVRIRRVRPNAILPRYATAGAAGMDLHACLTGSVVLLPALVHRGMRVDCLYSAPEVETIPTGIAIELPPGYEAQVRPRSGLMAKHGVMAHFGTIDADYRGEIKVIMVNLGGEPFVVEPGMRIAQLVIAPVVRIQWDEVDELGVTERGSGGFGSTGVKYE